MATAGLNRMMLWGDYEGRRLEDRWLLGHLVRPEGRRAWFEAIGPDGVPVMLSITEALNDEEEMLERMQAAANVRHPNVVSVREAAISHLDDVPVVVAAMEMTEENLGDVLNDRLLTPAEGRQVLDAVLAALGALHGHGLVHAHVEANSVLAMGETIKLRTDCVRMGGSGLGAAAAEDVRAAARMATHAVTGRYPTGENDPVLQLLPETMARAVRRALTGIAGAAEVAALAGTRLELMPEIHRDPARVETLARTAIPAEEAGKALPEAGKVVAESGKAGEKRASLKADARPVAGPRIVAMRAVDAQAQAALFGDPFTPPGEHETSEAGWQTTGDEREGTRWSRAPYVIAAAIAVVLVAVFTVYGLLRGEPSEQKSSPPVTRAAETSAVPAPAVVPPVVSLAQVEGPGWRVVAYTFNTEAEARETAQAVAQRFAQLNPGVFAPRGGELWLVTLGGIMNRADALVLRDKAIDLGLPEDTYAQSFR